MATWNVPNSSDLTKTVKTIWPQKYRNAKKSKSMTFQFVLIFERHFDGNLGDPQGRC